MTFRHIFLVILAGVGVANAQGAGEVAPVEGVGGMEPALITPVKPAPLEVVNPFSKATGAEPKAASAPAPAPSAAPTNAASAALPKKKSSGPSSPASKREPIDRSPVETLEEAFEGERLGTVNGLVVFRGAGSYLFKPEEKLKVKQTLSPKKSSSESGPIGAEGTAAKIPTPPQSPSAIQKPPSSVGSLPPSWKPAFNTPWGSQGATNGTSNTNPTATRPGLAPTNVFNKTPANQSAGGGNSSTEKR